MEGSTPRLGTLFSRKAVTNFTVAMVGAAEARIERLHRCEGQVVDFATEATRVTVDVLERTIFSEGFGRDPEDIRMAMKAYFETIGRIDPFDVFGIPAFVPRPYRRTLRPTLRLFERAIDTIISTRRERLARAPIDVPRDILTLLLEAARS